MIEVRDRLAHREKTLLHIKLAPEQQRHDLGRRYRCDRSGFELGKPGRVVRAQLRHARMDSDERQPVRGQHERLGWQVLEPAKRVQEATERVAFERFIPNSPRKLSVPTAVGSMMIRPFMYDRDASIRAPLESRFPVVSRPM